MKIPGATGNFLLGPFDSFGPKIQIFLYLWEKIDKLSNNLNIRKTTNQEQTKK